MIVLLPALTIACFYGLLFRIAWDITDCWFWTLPVDLALCAHLDPLLSCHNSPILHECLFGDYHNKELVYIKKTVYSHSNES